MRKLKSNFHSLATLFIILSFIGLGFYTYKSHVDSIASSTILKKRKANYDGYVTFYEDTIVQCGWVDGSVAMYSAPSTNTVAKKILKNDVNDYLSDAANRHICVY